VPEKVEINVVEDVPYIYFDFIPNSALFRMEALRDYCWDEKYVITFEHLDFYWAHKKLGKWKFAVTPAVFFTHNPGGDKIYRKFRFSKERYKRSKEYFLKKWNLNGVIKIQTNFLSQNYSLTGVMWLRLKKRLPLSILKYMMVIEENWPRR